MLLHLILVNNHLTYNLFDKEMRGDGSRQHLDATHGAGAESREISRARVCSMILPGIGETKMCRKPDLLFLNVVEKGDGTFDLSTNV